MLYFRTFIRDLKNSAQNWSNDNITLHSSALAYYTVFSIAPLLVIAIAIAGYVLGEKASQGEIFGEVQSLIGSSGASTVQSMVQSAASRPHSGVLTTILGVVTLLLGASGVFQQLQQSLNLIWKVQTPSNQGILRWLWRRIFTVAMVGVITFLLLVSLIVSAMISAAGKYFGTSLLWQCVNFIVSIGVITILFASVYKFLPDIKLKWKELWAGSLLTAILFSIGKWLIGLYIGRSSISSSYGATGSLVVLLMWAYYSAMIFFFGAEFIKTSTFRKNKSNEKQSM